MSKEEPPTQRSFERQLEVDRLSPKRASGMLYAVASSSVLACLFVGGAWYFRAGPKEDVDVVKARAPREPGAETASKNPLTGLSDRSAGAQEGVVGVDSLSAGTPSASGKSLNAASLNAASVDDPIASHRPPIATSEIATSESEGDGEVISERTAATREEQEKTLDPSNDGWDSEARSELTNAQYQLLAKWLQAPGGPVESQLATLVTDDFACSALGEIDGEKAFDDGTILVRRGGGAGRPESERDLRGAERFLQAIDALLAPLEGAEHLHVKFKQFRIDRDDKEVKTTAYFHAFGVTARGPVEINSVWNCGWRIDGEERVLLARVDVSDVEHAEARLGASTLYVDRSAAVLGGEPIFQHQLMKGVAYWRNCLPSAFNLQYHGHMGLGVGDVNGDGLDDVYLCQPGGLPNALFVHQADGSVKNSAAEAGVDFLNYTRGALFVDLDNDGDQDLVLTVIGQLTILANDGTGRFTIRAEMPTIRGAYSISAADFDQDADLDLYVCRHQADGHEKGDFPIPYPYYDANNGGRNFFVRNDGNWRFTDVTNDLGLDVDNSRYSFASSWEDYDNDGDIDLYVANDFGRNTLYRNDGGKFTSAADAVGLENTGFGMSVSWGDYNRDGFMDAYIGNMFSAAGNRITFQDQFRPESSADARAKYQRTARGNALYENNGDGTFRDVSIQAAVTVGRWSWGSLFADVNNDGLEDLIVSNGFVTGDVTDDL